ncbi:terpenoid synthase [Athelia psychrophila]|uniref:Terpenoid synthase n=1 Tax=Athelia psychrophila TaxID=1759441 RepID=A0A166KTU7_9AGAM|nr:terpenoid synthase [Fibularhizoctonia sp. CBS 109695]
MSASPESLDRSRPTRITPDLFSHCNFATRVNRRHKQAAAASKRWLLQGIDGLSSKKRQALHGLKAGLLASVCYPHAGYPQLRVCCNFLNCKNFDYNLNRSEYCDLFHLDDLSDAIDKNGTQTIADVALDPLYHPTPSRSSSRVSYMTKDFWRRYLSTSSCGSQQRFVEIFDLFFQAVAQEAKDRKEGLIPGFHFMERPAVNALDLFSFNKEQFHGDTYTIVPGVMKERGLDMQSAVDFVGHLYHKTIDHFNDARVVIHIGGLSDWIIGGMHWSFQSERYFGKDRNHAKVFSAVHLLPAQASGNFSGGSN